MDNKYLNEKDYLKTRKTMKIIGIISTITGFFLIAYGIFCGKEYKLAFIIGGIFVILVLGGLLFDSRKLAAYLAQQSMPIQKEAAKEITKEIKKELKNKEK